MVRAIGLVLLMAIVIGFITTSGALAQDEPGESALVSAQRLFDHFVVGGGLITWLVLIPLSIATIALMMEHTLSIRQKTILPDETLEQVRSALNDKRYIDVIQITASQSSVLAAAINSGLSQAANGYAAIQRTAADVIDHRAGRLMRKIEYLNVIGNVSPMIGLFGTVYGMIRLFASIKGAGGIPEPAKIADDISIALVTTFWGLLVAIPALSSFAFFRNRVDELISECATTVDRLLTAFDPAAASEAQAG